MIYLACPYSHPNLVVRAARELAASRWAALNPQTCYFSPLTHGVRLHNLNPSNGLNWVERDLEYLRLCDAMHIMMLPGYLTSKGVQIELQTAKDMDIPISSIACVTIKELLNGEPKIAFDYWAPIVAR